MSSTPFEDPPIADLDDPELLAAVRKRLADAHQSLKSPTSDLPTPEIDPEILS